MKSSLVVVCLLSACATLQPVRSPGERGGSGAARRAEVMELERGYWAAEQRHDSVTMDSLLAPEYVSMSSRGGADRDKGAELALLLGGRVHLEDFTFSAIRAASITQDVVVLHYVVDQRFTIDGRRLCPHSGSMTVWVRRAGRWFRAARTEYAISPGSAECAAQ